MSQNQEFKGLSSNPHELLELFDSGQFDKLSEKILEALEYFNINNTENLSTSQKQFVNILIKTIVIIIAKPEFQITDKYSLYFIDQNTTIANLLALSDYKNSDSLVPIVLKQQMNFYKILTLYNYRTSVPLDLEKLFQINKYLTSLWLSKIFASRWLAPKASYDLANKLLSDSSLLKNYTVNDKGFPISEDPTLAFFHATYVNPENDTYLRQAINMQIKQEFRKSFNISGTDPKKILIISANMLREHAVYKSIAPMLQELKKDYTIDLFHLGVEKDLFPSNLFKKIHLIKTDPKKGNFTFELLEEILAEKYGIILFTDIGLNRPSVILANLRMAPVQISMYGHPVSSDGAEIDYFIAGEDSEIADAQKLYKEKLIKIKGIGSHSLKPNYDRIKLPKRRDEIAISCSWGNLKFNYPHLLLLKKILEKSRKKITYNFIGMRTDCFLFPVAQSDIAELFGSDNFVLHKQVPYISYMQKIENCHFALDSYHYGGFNRVIDTLHCGLPIVILEGDRAYNRMSTAIIKNIGLEKEMVAKNPIEFIDKSLKFIEDDEYRMEVVNKIETSDFIEKQKANESLKSFVDAVRFTQNSSLK